MFDCRLEQKPTAIQLPDLWKKAKVNTMRIHKAVKHTSKGNMDLLPISRNIRKDIQNYLFPEYVKAGHFNH